MPRVRCRETVLISDQMRAGRIELVGGWLGSSEWG